MSFALDDRPIQVCCVSSAQPAQQVLNRIGWTSFAVHLAGFFFAIVPFAIVNMQVDMPNFFGWVVVPTTIVLTIGGVSGMLLLESTRCCALQSQLCAAAALAIVATAFHALFAFVESIVFWTSGLAGAVDVIAGLLLPKNVACISLESATFSAAFAAQRHIIAN